MARGRASYRPPVMGVTHMVSCGHPLAAAAGSLILEQGGNAIDAGVASGIAINVTLPGAANFGGVAPIILYHAESNEVVVVSGLGRYPKAATVAYFEENHGGDLPEGILRSVVPSAPDAWMTALERYGTMTFEQVVAPAIELAERGFPTGPRFTRGLELRRELWSRWPYNVELLAPNGRVHQPGEVFVQKDLARSLRRLAEVERANGHKGREGAIRAARDYFYKGEMAEEIVRFNQEQGGLMTMEDMAEFSVGVEKPQSGRYKSYTVYTCGPWCQGPVVAETLQMLEHDDLRALGHNSADYLHLVNQALTLSFSDRHHYYGDPDLVDVPIQGMLSTEYTRDRREAVDMKRAFPEMPPPGAPWEYQGPTAARPAATPQATAAGDDNDDTSYTCAVDRWGNAFSATPSDWFTAAPVIPGLGFIISMRGIQIWLDPDHPSGLQPGKRPRLTPNPAMAFKDGKLFMPFGAPGGDGQCQAMVQVFLNIVEFGMDPQQAVEAPRVTGWNFPNSFWPHTYLPARLMVEGRIDPAVIRELESRGHDVEVKDDWMPWAGGPCAIRVDQERGVLMAGADPRNESYAAGR